MERGKVFAKTYNTCGFRTTRNVRFSSEEARNPPSGAFTHEFCTSVSPVRNWFIRGKFVYSPMLCASRQRPLRLRRDESESSTMSHRILLVDDEVDILEFVRYNLVREGYEVFTAQNGAEALKVALECRPHLILLDMMMPVMDGAQTCRAIRENPLLKDTMVVFLSALGEEEQQLAGFGVGADDYLTKPIKMKLLVSRVQAILKRIDIGREQPSEAKPSGITIDRESYRATIDGKPLPLPRKEFELLALLCATPGRLVTREEIYATVWGSEVIVGDRTIDVHIRKLRQKIGEGRIVTVKGVGYKYEP